MIEQKETNTPPIINTNNLSIFYGNFRAVKDVDLNIPPHKITAIIGPSGCGKSTVLRSFNRMNDFIPSCHVDGKITFHGHNIYDDDVDPVQVRQRIGMVFQKANPFPKSIFDNVSWGLKINGMKGDLSEPVEQALRQAALWDEVKDHLKK
jgi:phosphate transport system ATP-binding protein